MTASDFILAVGAGIVTLIPWIVFCLCVWFGIKEKDAGFGLYALAALALGFIILAMLLDLLGL